MIEDRRLDLQDKLHRLNQFQYLCSKNSFPESYDDYLFSLIKSKNNFFYEIMNQECEYSSHTLWDETNVDMGYDYCTLTPHGTELCTRCSYHMDVIKRYKELTKATSQPDRSSENDRNQQLIWDPQRKMYYRDVTHSSSYNNIDNHHGYWQEDEKASKFSFIDKKAESNDKMN